LLPQHFISFGNLDQHADPSRNSPDQNLKANNTNLETGEKYRGRSSSLLGRWLYEQDKIDPDGLAFDFAEFSNWVKSKYSNSYSNTSLSYSNRYSHLVIAENLREIDLLPDTIKNNVINSLIVVSKFLRKHLELILYVCVS
jgi:hypothetical protein